MDHLAGAILAIGMAAGCALAQQEAAEKHVPEITAESKTNHPQGVANSLLCQRAREQHPPYSSFRVHEPNLAKMEKDLAALMRASDEVVMVGTPLRWVTALSPSGEDAISYADARVLRSWKGSHKVGDVITLGSWQGTVTCGPSHGEFSGTTVGPSPRFLYHMPSPTYSPDGPYVLFLRRRGEGSQIEAFRLAGGNDVQGLFDLVPGQLISDRHSAYGSCFRASYDQLACHSYPHGWSPEWCRDPQIDAENIAQCNAAVSASKEPIFAKGFDEDPLRGKYQGKPIASFLRAVDTAADEQRHSERAQGTNP
jgi:hypothetical protein